MGILGIDNPNELKDDWSVTVHLTTHSPIFKNDPEDICHLFLNALVEENEYIISDGFEVDAILIALRDSIDFDKLKRLLPQRYYLNGNNKLIVKSDLVRWYT